MPRSQGSILISFPNKSEDILCYILILCSVSNLQTYIQTIRIRDKFTVTYITYSFDLNGIGSIILN